MIRGKHAILDLPLLFLIAEIAMPWIMGGEGFETRQHIRILYFSSMFTLFLFAVHFKLFDKRQFVYTATTLLFLVLVLTTSTEVFESFKKWLKIAPALLAFPVYNQYFSRRPHMLKGFYYRLVLYNTIFVLSMVVSSILRIGTGWGYGNNRFVFLVGYNIWALYSVIYSVTLSLFLSQMNKNRMLSIILWAQAIALGIILLLIFKRMLIVTYLLGIYFYLLTTLNMDKRKYLYLSFVIVGLIIAYQYSQELLHSLALGRQRIFELQNYAEEGRALELINYFKYWIQEEKAVDILFGRDFFRSGFNEFEAITLVSGDRGRIIHSDLANLLYTTGLVGTIMFIALLKKSLGYAKKALYKSSMTKNAFTYVLLAISLNLFSEGIDIGQNYFMPLAMIGAICGAISSSGFTSKKYKENTYV